MNIEGTFGRDAIVDHSHGGCAVASLHDRRSATNLARVHDGDQGRWQRMKKPKIQAFICDWFHIKHHELRGGSFDSGFNYLCRKCGRNWIEPA